VWTWLRLGHLHSAAEYAVPLPRLGLHRRLKDGLKKRKVAQLFFGKLGLFEKRDH
jgi:hypothetical protein